MAALVRQVRQSLRPFARAVLFTGTRNGSTSTKKPEEVFDEMDREPRTSISGFYQNVSEDKYVQEEVPQRLGGLGGEQRNEILETLRGNKDPFDVIAKKQVDVFMGNFDTPILVPSTQGERLVGCICEEDATEVVWMLLYSGEKKKCSCGNWFQLHDVEGALDH